MDPDLEIRSYSSEMTDVFVNKRINLILHKEVFANKNKEVKSKLKQLFSPTKWM